MKLVPIRLTVEATVDQKTKREVKTGVVTLTRADLRRTIRSGALTDEEERYVRVLFGISEPASTVLERRGGQFADTRARLALIEGLAVAEVMPRTSNPLKSRIIQRLKTL